MVATSAPFGLRPLRGPNGLIRSNKYAITSGAAAMFQNQPVKIASDGSITPAAVSDAFIGGFDGCEYTSGGKRFVQNFWPGGTVSSDAFGFAYDDPETIYAVQSVGSVAQTAIGEHADFSASINTGSAVTGQSTAVIAASASSGTAQMQIVGLFTVEGNAWGDSFTVVETRIAKHQLAGNRAAAFA